MTIQEITEKDRKTFNTVVNHPLQSYEWGEFREKTSVNVIREGFFEKNNLISGYSMTLHPVPHTPFKIGYLPKGDFPTKDLVDRLNYIGRVQNCIFIQLEPNVTQSQISNLKSRSETKPDLAMQGPANEVSRDQISKLGLKPAAHPLFTKYTFVLDLTKSEDELLANLHQKARYNIKVARKHDVKIVEDNSDDAFEEYWKLTGETTNRQGFYAHTKNYHKLQWQTINSGQNKHSELTSHLFLAKYQGKTLAAWLLFIFKDTLYYPYGASSSENREVMASNLMMWEAILYGKKQGLKKFDMWGALGPDPDIKDPWFGFHNFKEKYGPQHIEFIGSYDLIINPLLYQAYKSADKLRWLLLKLKR